MSLTVVDWCIYNLHLMLGHDKTAAVLGVAPGDKMDCAHCQADRGEITRQQAIDLVASRS